MQNHEKTAAVIVAGGSSTRMGFDKLLAVLDGLTVIEKSVLAFSRHPLIDEIVVVAGAANICRIQALVGSLPKVKAVVLGGPDRAASVRCGLAQTDAEWLAIHDGARPFVSENVITQVLQAAAATGCAAPAVPVKDTIRRIDETGRVCPAADRSRLFCMQTPQVVRAGRYRLALDHIKDGQVTDDCMVMEQDGCEVRLSSGEYENRKITTPEDLPPQPPAMRIGHGYDVHRLAAGRRLILGGCEIPFEKGLDGHSDADVLTHAVMDALLGAAACGDIGRHFPDTDPAFEGADSLVLLQKVCGLLARKGWRPGNIDATILCQRPKLAPYIDAMCEHLAHAMNIGQGQVSVKATTEEKLGFTGAGEGIAAHCVALVVPAFNGESTAR